MLNFALAMLLAVSAMFAMFAARMEPDLTMYSPLRSIKVSGLGVIVDGAVLPTWYKLIQRVIPGRNLKDVAAKVGSQDLVVASLVVTRGLSMVLVVPFQVLLDLSIMGLSVNFGEIIVRGMLEGSSLNEAIRHARTEIKEVYKYDVLCWGLYDVILYSVIPQK